MSPSSQAAGAVTAAVEPSGVAAGSIPDDVHDPAWVLKRRHEDLSQTFRTSWELYIKFYTVFLTFSVAGLGWLLTQADAAKLSPQIRVVIVLVFLVQTVLTGLTSAGMAVYTRVVRRDQREIEQVLIPPSMAGSYPSVSAIPVSLGTWAGVANCVAMVVMAAFWTYIGLL